MTDQIKKVLLFGQERDLIINYQVQQYRTQPIYQWANDHRSLILFCSNFNQVNKVYLSVLEDIFDHIVMTMINLLLQENRQVQINSVRFRKNQTEDIELKIKEKPHEITNVVTTAKCDQCNNKMVLRTNNKSGNRFLGCANYPNCRRTINLNNDGLNSKSKQGIYLYFGPSILEYDIDIIKAKIIFHLVASYCEKYSPTFFTELAKWCPDFFIINPNFAWKEMNQAVMNQITSGQFNFQLPEKANWQPKLKQSNNVKKLPWDRD